jgi:hypothetical protein
MNQPVTWDSINKIASVLTLLLILLVTMDRRLGTFGKTPLPDMPSLIVVSPYKISKMSKVSGSNFYYYYFLFKLIMTLTNISNIFAIRSNMELIVMLDMGINKMLDNHRSSRDLA